MVETPSLYLSIYIWHLFDFQTEKKNVWNESEGSDYWAAGRPHGVGTGNKIHKMVLVVIAKVSEMQVLVQLQCSVVDEDSNFC